jgi:2-dehydropantoate 2-reductase
MNSVSPRIAIVGLGAIGVSLADALHRSGLRVAGFSATDQSMFQIDDRGRPRQVTVPVRLAVTPESRGAFDLVFFCLKNDVLAKTFASYLDLLAPTGLVVCAQNGVMEYFMADHFDPRRILGAQVKAGCYLTPPDQLVITHPLQLVVGPLEASHAQDEQVARALAELGALPFVRAVPDILPYKWSKLVFTSVTNPLAAITGFTADRLLKDRASRPVILGLLDETLRLADAEGIALAKEGPFDPRFFRHRTGWRRVLQGLALQLFALSLKGMKVSMLHDIELGRKTEIELLNGVLLQRARRFHMTLPGHDLTVQLIHDLEQGRLRPGTQHLQAFANLFPRA